MAKWLTVGLSLGLASGALAQQPSCVMPREDLVRPEVHGVVTQSAGGFEYRYAVTNKAEAQQRLVSFAVEAFTTPPPVQTSPPAWEAGGPMRSSSLFVWDTFVLAVLQTEGVLPLHRPPLPEAWEIVAFNLLVLNIVGCLAALLSEAYRESRQRLHALNAEIERAHDEAQRLNGHIQQAARLSVLGDVVGGVTHEVRNVLQSVFGQLWMVRRKLRDAPAEITEHLDEIESSCEGAMRIIRTTLDMARHPASDAERVLLAGVAERVAQLKAYDLRRDRIALSLEFEAGMPAVTAAVFQLQQVLLNLVSNAQDELRQVGGRRDVVIAGFVQGDDCVVEVRDNGRGIPSKALARIFEPFFTTKPTGTGLGLAISAGIVESLGGRLSAGNRNTGGATFRITLPAAT